MYLLNKALKIYNNPEVKEYLDKLYDYSDLYYGICKDLERAVDTRALIKIYGLASFLMYSLYGKNSPNIYKPDTNRWHSIVERIHTLDNRSFRYLLSTTYFKLYHICKNYRTRSTLELIELIQKTFLEDGKSVIWSLSGLPSVEESNTNDYSVIAVSRGKGNLPISYTIQSVYGHTIELLTSEIKILMLCGLKINNYKLTVDLRMFNVDKKKKPELAGV